MPNLFVILILFTGLFLGEKMGILFGILFGFILDLMFGKTIGASSLLFGIIGYLGEYFDKNFSKDNKLMIIATGVGATLIYEIGMYLVSIARFQIDVELPNFIFNLLVENLFNTLLIIIFYTGIKRLGYYIEDNYRGRKFLTRYF